EIGELAGNINDMAMSIQNFEKRRTDFISDVSHELRTPMTSISGFIEGIIDGTISNADAPKYLDVVLSETKRLSRLVSDLLSLSRIDDGRMVINKSTFDIVELARLIIIKFEKIITTKGIEVNFESDSESLEVFADKDSLTQVLTNLFHNAVKFAPDGGYVRISISENNNKCLICIVNNGHGIEPDKLDFIWERFYKTDYSRSSDRSGVGLGLYIVKRILDAHGEKINVTSEVDGETVFSFSLDLA
ncbi:MAG: HAMP domain-containing sensor histidine kinase, partial [Clostridia bacterium]|nr:HAMP domain-containing sensor histidine kinase [Clostridia bacterium]